MLTFAKKTAGFDVFVDFMMLSVLTNTVGEKFEKIIKFIRGDHKIRDKSTTVLDQE